MWVRWLWTGLSAALAVVLWDLPVSAVRQSLSGPIPARVVEVIDGDTLLVEARIWLDHVVTTGVRLAGVDAPELNGACPAERVAAEAARAYLGDRIADGSPDGPVGAEVVLHEVRWGKYAGRVLARVTTAAGTDLAAALLTAGHVRRYAGGRRPG
ncbi:MAG: thermonuclease family protein [Kiloniellales bacterium]